MSEFHIHIDASKLSVGFEAILNSLNFKRFDFRRDPDHPVCYAPDHHLTLKLDKTAEFKRIFELVEQHAEGAMVGYIEGEFLPLDLDIPEKPFDPAAARPPFQFTTAPLPDGKVRESELHITLDMKRSDERLIDALHQMGLIVATMTKRWGVAIIFTIQGKRPEIDQVRQPMIDYLLSVGGSVRGSIKEEVVAKWWMSSPDVARPPVISSIVRHNDNTR